ncbi:hypothetical protein GRI41_13225 [Altererythrobacter aquaemixtae]|uniref:Pili assembly chaperone N-terminal domain-containing protein n=2 Tax=Pontixanthobacter aquaemixtae TaxID=1958940 RepID=A0A844ZUW8_9SPHN|nr:hypothetical protein [Pontixanthobacter aquaemixtae]
MALAAAPAVAVGLSPLEKGGLTDSASKAFYLTVINPYNDVREFKLYVERSDGSQVEIRPQRLRIAGQKQRRVLVILNDLAPGEAKTVRVCASLAKQQGIINARVCSDLSARRVDRRAVEPGDGN